VRVGGTELLHEITGYVRLIGASDLGLLCSSERVKTTRPTRNPGGHAVSAAGTAMAGPTPQYDT